MFLLNSRPDPDALIMRVLVLSFLTELFLFNELFLLPQVVEVVSTLPDISLPAIQPYYRPLPSIDLTPLSPQRRKGAYCFLMLVLSHCAGTFILVYN